MASSGAEVSKEFESWDLSRGKKLGTPRFVTFEGMAFCPPSLLLTSKLLLLQISSYLSWWLVLVLGTPHPNGHQKTETDTKLEWKKV